MGDFRRWIPDVRYARSGEVAIAYQVVGEGPPVDIVFVRGFAGDLLSTWDQPLLLRHVLGLAAFARVLMLDKRGTGLFRPDDCPTDPRDPHARSPRGHG
jgi:pimeloyl-ACP methyl ester carboxylesterase